MINNFKFIQPLLNFNDSNYFYFLQIIQRKKENPQLSGNSHVIKSYYINNMDYLHSNWKEIKILCDTFNARAMINLNRRNVETVALKTLVKIANQIADKNYLLVYRAYQSVAGQVNNEKPRRWILDIDDIRLYNKYKYLIYDLIQRVQPANSQILAEIPSKNGIHIITTPFDLIEFNKLFFLETDGFSWGNVFEIHKNNPTNLYIP